MTMQQKIWTVAEEHNRMRIIPYLDLMLDTPHRINKNIVENNLVGINNEAARWYYIVRTGDTIDCMVPDDRPVSDEPEDLPVDIVYEDDDIVIVNKEKGMAVHPAPGNYVHTLKNAMLFRYPGTGPDEIRFAHRLDMMTSGLLVCTRSKAARRSIGAQIFDHSCRRVYHALVAGCPDPEEGVIDAPIGRDPGNFRRMWVTDRESKDARTSYRVLERFANAALVELVLDTGRTHQIRVHMSYIGHPLLNDPVYGTVLENAAFAGQALHACSLTLVHPTTKEKMTFTVPYPAWFEELLAQCRAEQ
ncbi:MAG: RluA family pseudouridine synthase [Solobacterium sp.]|nr:RluA family pseudouridine synthase [Solobacterium sp.]